MQMLSNVLLKKLNILSLYLTLQLKYFVFLSGLLCVISPFTARDAVAQSTNSETELNQVIDFNFNSMKEVYQFFQSKPLNINIDLKEINIEIKKSNEILKII